MMASSSATTMENDMKEANNPAVMNEHSQKIALTHGLNDPYLLMGEVALCSCGPAGERPDSTAEP